MLAAAPHIIWPMRFVLPHSPDDRPAWLLRIGLYLYDHLGGRRRLPGTRTLNLTSCPEGEVIKPEYRRGFEFSDCWVDDSRLTILNALSAHEQGARVMTRTRFTSAQREDSLWRVSIEDTRTGESRDLFAKAIVNAAGPWVNHIIAKVSGAESQRRVRLVKGSHLVLKKFWKGEHSFLIQNTDKRVIFVNPYEGDYALIGTTDIPFEGDPSEVRVDTLEVDYLLKALNRYFVNQFTTRDVIESFSGVRPLYDDNSDNPSSVTRDYLFDVDDVSGEAPLLCIFGGKITTFRKLAEHALDKLIPYFPTMGAPWTAAMPLPGGDIGVEEFDHWVESLKRQYPQFPESVVYHYARLYGTRIEKLLDGITSVDELGRYFGSTFYEIEARYLIEVEWAQSVEDVLQRRTKFGLHLSGVERTEFDQWFASEYPHWNKMEA